MMNNNNNVLIMYAGPCAYKNAFDENPISTSDICREMSMSRHSSRTVRYADRLIRLGKR